MAERIPIVLSTSGDLEELPSADTLPTGAITPAGTNNQLQFNANGSFGATPEWTYDDTINIGQLSGIASIAASVLYLENTGIGSAVRSTASADSGTIYAGLFEATSSSHTGTSYGVNASSASASGVGVNGSGSGATSIGVYGSSSGATGIGVKGLAVQGTASAGQFINIDTLNPDNEVVLATGTDLIIGTVGGVEEFKVTDAGAVTGDSFNGVALTTAGAATDFLNAAGNYVAAGGSSNNWLTANNGADFTTAPIATGSGSISLGEGATTAAWVDSIAIGKATVTGAEGIAIGSGASSGGVAIGIGENAVGGAGGCAVGRNASSTGNRSLALGQSAIANFTQATSVGFNLVASQIGQTLIGQRLDSLDTTTDVAYSVKIGANETAATKNLLHLFSKGKLELYGDEAQFIFPSYTTATLPVTTNLGGAVYDTDTNSLKIYDAGWNEVGGSTTPGGSDAALQYNNGGAFGGMSNWWYDDTTYVGQILSVTSGLPAAVLDVANQTTTGVPMGAKFVSSSTVPTISYGVWGDSKATSGTGIYGTTNGASGISVYGVASGLNGIGVQGTAGTTQGKGGYFENTSGTDTQVSLATDTDLIIGELDGVEKFKVTGEGQVTISCQVSGTQLLSLSSYAAATDGIIINLTGTGPVIGLKSSVSSALLGAIGVQGIVAAPTEQTVGVDGQSYSTTGRGVQAIATALTGVNYGLFASSASPDGKAGYFENTDGTDTEVSLATGTDLIICSVDGVEEFKVTGTGDVLGGAFTGITFNGVALDSISAGNLFLADDGIYKAVPSQVGGATTQIQYNNAGAFAGLSSMTTDGTAVTLNGTSTPMLTVSGGTSGGAQLVNLTTTGAATDGLIISATGTGLVYGIKSNVSSALATAGYFENTNGTATKVTLATPANLIIGTLDGVVKFNVSDAGIVDIHNTLDMNSQDIDNIKTATFIAEVANTGTTQTIDWTAGQKQNTTITAATSVTFTAPAGPCNLTLKITNGGLGTITWPATVIWSNGDTEPTWSSADTDIASFYYDGTNYRGMAWIA